jgi:RHS repeat-associated protein
MRFVAGRLVGWEPLLFVSGAKKVEFKYDYLGRRIEKRVEVWDPNGPAWVFESARRYVWGTSGSATDWLLLAEFEVDPNSLELGEPARKLTWGRDLSGSLDAAGGIGGLLAVHDPAAVPDPNDPNVMLPGDFIFFYDANGNVGQVIDLAASGAGTSIKAHYEYDVYGKVPVQSGSYAAANPYRFSTKPWDDETALGSWGQRYYDPRLGRWINHDPIGELGGLNLYAFVRNGLANAVDPRGLMCSSSFCGAVGPPSSAPVKPPAQTGPPGSQPTGPATQPTTQPNCTSCQECMQKALEDEKVKKLLADLRKKGCDPNPRCGNPNEPPCNIPGAGGGYDGLGGTGITMCGTFSPDKLYHELIHAWQFCGEKGHPGGPKGDPDPPKANIVACNEVEAYACSGNCGPVNWQDPKFVACVGNGCIDSLLAYCNQNPAACPADKATWNDWANKLCQRGINSPSCRRCDKIPGAQ